MAHPSFDILSQLLKAAPGHSTSALPRFRDEVWSMPVWAPGGQVAVANGQTATSLHLAAGTGDALPLLPAYLNEAEANDAQGSGNCITVPFRFLILFAESNRLDVALNDGGQVLAISHDGLMALRDAEGLGGEGVPVTAEEVGQMASAVERFAAQARAYCASQAEIASLHLSLVSITGVKPMLIGWLDGGRGEQAAALELLSRQFLQPNWRCMVFDGLRSEGRLVEELTALPAVYERQASQGWFGKMKQKLSAPAVHIIQLDVC